MVAPLVVAALSSACVVEDDEPLFTDDELRDAEVEFSEAGEDASAEAHEEGGEPADEKPAEEKTFIDCDVADDDDDDDDDDDGPFTTPEGKVDQGNGGWCVPTSLINANIRAGADNTGGKFLSAMKKCLTKKGHPLDKMKNGVRVDSSAWYAIIACKIEVMAGQGHDVSITTQEGYNDWLFGDHDWEDECPKIASALGNNGSATAAFTHRGKGGGHQVTITSVDCETGEIQFSDPNHPGNPIYTGKIVGEDPPELEDVTPPHFSFSNGDDIALTDTAIEVHDD